MHLNNIYNETSSEDLHRTQSKQLNITIQRLECFVFFVVLCASSKLSENRNSKETREVKTVKHMETNLKTYYVLLRYQ